MTEPHPDIRHPSWDAGRPGMQGRRVCHRVVLVRHGETDCNRKLVTEGRTLEVPPMLTERGRAQAEEVAARLTALGVVPTSIEASSLQRALDTAAPTRARYPEVPFEVPGLQLVEYSRKLEPRSEFLKRREAILERWRAAGSPGDRKQTIVFTHSQLISQLLSLDVQHHLANGSFTVLDFDEEGEVHVHVVNATAHLAEPTGQHTVFT